MTTAPGLEDFDRDPRRQQEYRLRPWANAIYQNLWPGVSTRRKTTETATVLDRVHGIDLDLVLPNGMVLTVQEKFLSAGVAGFESLTVEYMQNPATGERGDWFHLGCQMYFCGYERQDGHGFGLWVLANWPAVVIASAAGQIDWHDQINKDGHARASFRWCKIRQLPPACIYAASWLRGWQ